MTLAYASLPLILAVTLYTFNFARQEWKRGNRLGGTGVGLLAVTSLLFPIWALFFR